MLKAGYICDESTATVLFLAEELRKPILVEGPAGVGQTSIAQAFASMKKMPLIRPQCYEGIDETKALYEWNYKKQLLYIQAVANKNLDTKEIEQEIFSIDFLLTRPLLQAITSPSPCCLLVDEIDKVDFEFEALLLELTKAAFSYLGMPEPTGTGRKPGSSRSLKTGSKGSSGSIPNLVVNGIQETA